MASKAAIAHAVNPEAIDHCLFAHVADDGQHARVIHHLGQRPLLDLGLHLGEGTGAALGVVLVKTALHLHANMASYENAGITRPHA